MRQRNFLANCRPRRGPSFLLFSFFLRGVLLHPSFKQNSFFSFFFSLSCKLTVYILHNRDTTLQRNNIHISGKPHNETIIVLERIFIIIYLFSNFYIYKFTTLQSYKVTNFIFFLYHFFVHFSIFF